MTIRPIGTVSAAAAKQPEPKKEEQSTLARIVTAVTTLGLTAMAAVSFRAAERFYGNLYPNDLEWETESSVNPKATKPAQTEPATTTMDAQAPAPLPESTSSIPMGTEEGITIPINVVNQTVRVPKTTPEIKIAVAPETIPVSGTKTQPVSTQGNEIPVVVAAAKIPVFSDAIPETVKPIAMPTEILPVFPIASLESLSKLNMKQLPEEGVHSIVYETILPNAGDLYGNTPLQKKLRKGLYPYTFKTKGFSPETIDAVSRVRRILRTQIQSGYSSKDTFSQAFLASLRRIPR